MSVAPAQGRPVLAWVAPLHVAADDGRELDAPAWDWEERLPAAIIHESGQAGVLFRGQIVTVPDRTRWIVCTGRVWDPHVGDLLRAGPVPVGSEARGGNARYFFHKPAGPPVELPARTVFQRWYLSAVHTHTAPDRPTLWPGTCLTLIAGQTWAEHIEKGPPGA